VDILRRMSSPVLVSRLSALGALAFGLLACKASGGSNAPATVVVDASADPDAPRTPTIAATTAESAAEGDATADGTSDDAKKPKWNVEAAHGPQRTVKLDVDEGTWMSLDVSPDGTTIVFDLLGDLYTMPIGGGEAKSLTSGVAWDMQPTFSPDGRFIAFTSDRGGGDNIWVMGSDGASEPRAVTTEEFRLLNSPAWSPDGAFIAARKHFTKQRSLGSGEMWLYHVSGGEGLQMTEKPNDQKDVGEPVFSPDGTWLYYSQDVTPGPVFDYNKDPHAGIYAIKRLHREEGRTETVLSGPGGACRPTPSPNGKQLAYVRRLGLKTALMVHDLDSGQERPVFTDLDRDMQETWAIHGVYPAFDWTPDNKSIVVWAGGKIRRITLATAAATTIPFHVADERKVAEALRFPVEVHPKTFRSKMLRWVEVSPRGDLAVFSALGKLYLKDLSSGKVRRVTRDEDRLEFYPSFSRDGRSLVFVAWDDAKLASVQVVSVTGGRSRAVTSEPGHYLEPAFSPDGKQIVYRKARGGGIVSPRWSRDPGIYVVAARGTATPVLVTREGSEPHFGAASDRVFFTKYEGGGGEDSDGKQVLASIELTGARERSHASSEMAQRFRVSPDGQWIAWQEHFNAHIAPLPQTGRAIELSPKSKGLPVATVSRDTGAYLHWSGDSKTLHWSVGPQLFSRKLLDAFAFVEGAPEKLPEPATEGLDIGFTVDSDLPKGTIALVGARIVTMKGDEVVDDGVIVVEGNRIATVGPRGSVKIPAGAKVIDVAGKTIFPGLIDVHAHGAQGEDGIVPQHNWLHYATLAFGVTTVHDPSNDTSEIFTAAEMARAGELVSPRIFSTGTILYGAKASFTAKIDSLEDARGHLRRMKAVGAFSVKSYNQPRRNQRQQVVAAARELGMMVVPEGGSLFQHNMTMVVDGHTGVEHAIPVANGYADVHQLWGGTAVGYTPTTVVGYGGIWGENYWYAHTNVFDHPRLTTFVPPSRIDARARRRPLASKGDWNHFRVARLAKQLNDAGVKVNLGAHGQREGLAAHWELWMFVQGGMTPHEALRAGTLNGAFYLGLDGDLGSLEPGKLADLVVVDGDVLADIRRSEDVRFTMINGRLFDAATMDEVAPRARKRAPLAWERDGVWVRGTSDTDAHGCGCHAD
jgi:imidazolonepropionase-like amidohydrolase/Tol biopolymer transport system component